MRQTTCCYGFRIVDFFIQGRNEQVVMRSTWAVEWGVDPRSYFAVGTVHHHAAQFHVFKV